MNGVDLRHGQANAMERVNIVYLRLEFVDSTRIRLPICTLSVYSYLESGRLTYVEA